MFSMYLLKTHPHQWLLWVNKLYSICAQFFIHIHISSNSRLQPCTSNALFEFTWCLYICVKGEFHSSADDLVDMYHVLLSCLDFVFANAFMSRRIDLINPGFKGKNIIMHILVVIWVSKRYSSIHWKMRPVSGGLCCCTLKFLEN